MKKFGVKRTKRNLLIFGAGVLSFTVLIGAASITVALLNALFNGRDLDAYTISFIALTAFALIFTVAAVIMFYVIAQQSQTLVDSLARVAAGDYDTEIEYSARSTFKKVYENFNTMIRELRSVKSLREEFVHNFSHEVKTPLFSIQGFANLLLEGGLSEEEQKNLLRIISDETEKLIRLADNNLTISKIENQQILGERKLLKLDSEINECIILLEREWSKKGIEMSADLEPVRLTGDGEMLRHVWLNLLSNAVKFTPEGGKIEVRLKKRGNFAVAEFADSGCGISADDLPRIFEKYYRAKSSAGCDGSGLGLPICKRICEMCGGSVSAESREGEGSVFTVTLPVTEN